MCTGVKMDNVVDKSPFGSFAAIFVLYLFFCQNSLPFWPIVVGHQLPVNRMDRLTVLNMVKIDYCLTIIFGQTLESKEGYRAVR